MCTVAGQSIQVPVGRTALPNGAYLLRDADPYTGDSYQVHWADGTMATVWRANIYGLIVTVDTGQGARGNLVRPARQLRWQSTKRRGRSGGSPFTPAFDRLYPSFADSWRVTSASSLFDYPAGKSTATFTDRSLPTRPAIASALPASEQSEAQAACKAAGVSDPADLSDCTLDVAVTGSAAFAIADSGLDAAATATATASIQSSAPPTPAAAEPGLSAQSTSRLPARSPRPPSSGTQVSGSWWISLPPPCPTSAELLPCAEPTTTSWRRDVRRSGPTIQGAALPVDGPYTIYISPTGGATGSASLRIVTPTTSSVDHDRWAGHNCLDHCRRATILGRVCRLERPNCVRRCVGRHAAGRVHAVARGARRRSLAVGVPRRGERATSTGPPWRLTGTYHLVVNPQDDGTGNVTLKITSVHDQTIATTVNGPPSDIGIDQPGAKGFVTFDDTAGQRVRVTVTDATLPDQCGAITLKAPDQSIVTTGCIGGSGTFTSAGAACHRHIHARR